MSSKQEENRRRILRAVMENPTATMRWIGRQLGITHTTVSRVVKSFKESQTTERRAGSGRKSKTADPVKARKVLDYFKCNPNLSIRDAALKAKCSAWFVQQTMKRAGLRVFKVRKAPNRRDQQNTAAKSRARKLYREWLTKPMCVVMDDETYIKADAKQIPGLEFYVAKSRFDVPEDIRKKKVDKFAKKYLLWQAICQCGKLSKPYITTGTINSEIYRTECLQKRLLPFLRSHGGETLFWPDLASCHYARSTLDWYRDNNVVFVPKTANPPNSPEIRPVERFWAIMKAKVRKSSKVFKNELELKKEWMKVTKKVGSTIAQNVMRGLKGKVRAFSDGKEIE